MRFLVVVLAGLMIALSGSGCIADGRQAVEDLLPEFPQYSQSYEMDLPVGIGGAGDQDPAYREWTFDVAAGATLLETSGDWSCVSMCPLAITLIDPDGNTVSQDITGSWNTAVPEPLPGTWAVTIATGAEMTLGTQGALTITVS